MDTIFMRKKEENGELSKTTELRILLKHFVQTTQQLSSVLKRKSNETIVNLAKIYQNSSKNHEKNGQKNGS